MQKSSSRAVIGAGRVALGPVLRSEELEVEAGGLGRGIDSILPAGPVPAVAGPVVAATELVAAAAAELAAKATSPVVAAAKSGHSGVVSAK